MKIVLGYYFDSTKNRFIIYYIKTFVKKKNLFTNYQLLINYYSYNIVDYLKFGLIIYYLLRVVFFHLGFIWLIRKTIR